MNAEKNELDEILDDMLKQKKSYRTISIVDFGITCILYFSYFGYPVMLKYAPPLLFTAKQHPAALDIFSSQMTLVMTALRDMIMAYTSTRSKLKVSLEKVVNLQCQLDQWHQFRRVPPPLNFKI